MHDQFYSQLDRSLNSYPVIVEKNFRLSIYSQDLTSKQHSHRLTHLPLSIFPIPPYEF